MLKGIGLSRARHRLSGTRHPDHDHDRAAIRPADLLRHLLPVFLRGELAGHPFAGVDAELGALDVLVIDRPESRAVVVFLLDIIAARIIGDL
jgi:hypothetical protein